MITCWGWWQGKNLEDNWIRKIMEGFFPIDRFINTEIQDFTGMDFVLLGGGGLFSMGIATPWNKPLSCKYGIFGLGCELMKGEQNERKRLIENADFFYVRDRYSLYGCGLSNHNCISSDVTFLSPVCYKGYNGGNKIAFIWRDDCDYLNRIGNFAGKYDDKDEWLSQLQQFGEVTEVSFLTDESNPEVLLNDFDIIVSARYHGIIYAIQSGKPFIAIDVLPKLSAICYESGLSDFCLRPNESNKVVERLDFIIKGFSYYRNILRNYCEFSHFRCKKALQSALYHFPHKVISVSKKKKFALSVIVSSYNQLSNLILALQSYSKQSFNDFEVIVADDGSSDDTLKWLASSVYSFPVRYVTRTHNGYRLASLFNLAATIAEGERLLFTNADVLHCPCSFERHSELSENDIGGGVVKSIASHIKNIGLSQINDWETILKLQALNPSIKNNLAYIRDNDILGMWAGNFSIHKSAFGELSGFDEEFLGWGGEDTDLANRAKQRNMKLTWVIESEAVHLDHEIRQYAIEKQGTKRYLEKIND